MQNESESNESSWLEALGKSSALFGQGDSARVPAMFHAVRIAIDQLTKAGADRIQLKPLIALLHDLDRLNHGRPANSLKPRKGSGAVWPDRYQGAFAMRQAIAVEVQEIIYRSLGGTWGCRRIAQERAAELLNRYGFRTHIDHPITAAVLRQWCSDATDIGEESVQLRDCLSKLRSWLPEHVCSASDEAVAEELLSSFAGHPSIELS